MKRFLIAGVLALCLITSQIAHAAQDRNAQIKAHMVENYLLWQEAYKLRDAERIISFESPDFTNISLNGVITKKQEADEGVRYGMALFDKVYNAKLEIKKITIESNRIVILSHLFLDVGMFKSHRYSVNFTSRDIWVEYDHIWMLKRTEDIDRKFFSTDLIVS